MIQLFWTITALALIASGYACGLAWHCARKDRIIARYRASLATWQGKAWQAEDALRDERSDRRTERQDRSQKASRSARMGHQLRRERVMQRAAQLRSEINA